MSVESVWPTWSKERGPGFVVGLAIMRTYFQGRHDCSIEVPGAPPTFADYTAPRAFAALSKKLPELEVKGWSSLPSGDEASVATVKGVFTNEAKQPSR